MPDESVDRMLDAVNWKPVPAGDEKQADDVPYTTHEGTLTIGRRTLRCYQLSDGSRVFAAEDVESFFGCPPGEQLASHPLWPAFEKMVNEEPDWSFVGEHREDHMLALWRVFLAGAETESTHNLIGD